MIHSGQTLLWSFEASHISVNNILSNFRACEIMFILKKFWHFKDVPEILSYFVTFDKTCIKTTVD